MPRANRLRSQSGIYHVILRGVNKQRIFENPSDYEAFSRIMLNVRDKDTQQNPLSEPNFFLYAYCIMDNHVHLLIQPNIAELSNIMKRIMTSYAIRFNFTYERVGHLFQDRYKSEPVEDAKYFYTLLQYIHNNPVKAGICSAPDKYQYSSFVELSRNYAKTTKQGQTHSAITLGAELVQSLFGSFCNYPDATKMPLGITKQEVETYLQTIPTEDVTQGLLTRIKEFTQEQNNTVCQFLRLKLNWLTAEEQDQLTIATLYELTGVDSISAFQQLDKKTMRIALALLRDSGVQTTRLSRLTGVPIGVIRYAKVQIIDEEK